MQNYNLICGDIIEELKQMESKTISMIFADPPYRLSNGGITCLNGKMANVDKGNWDKSNGFEEDLNFNIMWLKECDRVLKDDGTMWISGTYHIIHNIGYILLNMGYHIINEIIWMKPNAAPNISCRCFTASHEVLIWVKKRKKVKHIFNYNDMKIINNGKQMRSVWNIPTTPLREKKYGYHPTQKPKELLYRVILSSTSEKDLILDPFCGSGTTGVVAIENNRSFIGIDSNKEFIELANKRISEIMYKDVQLDMFKEI